MGRETWTALEGVRWLIARVGLAASPFLSPDLARDRRGHFATAGSRLARESGFAALLGRADSVAMAGARRGRRRGRGTNPVAGRRPGRLVLVARPRGRPRRGDRRPGDGSGGRRRDRRALRDTAAGRASAAHCRVERLPATATGKRDRMAAEALFARGHRPDERVPAGLKTALLFPGQGSQSVGMRARLGPCSAAQDDLFARAERVFGSDLGRLIDEGPEAELTRTPNAQLRVLVLDTAHAGGLRERHRGRRGPGHSLGEYAALVVAGALDFGDAVRVVRARGRAMEEAALRTPRRMVAVLKAPPGRCATSSRSAERAGDRGSRTTTVPTRSSCRASARRSKRRSMRSGNGGSAGRCRSPSPRRSTASLMAPAAEALARSWTGSRSGAARGVHRQRHRRAGNPTRREFVRSSCNRSSRRSAGRTRCARRWRWGRAVPVESGPGSVLAALAKRIAPPGTPIATRRRSCRADDPAARPVSRAGAAQSNRLQPGVLHPGRSPVPAACRYSTDAEAGPD